MNQQIYGTENMNGEANPDVFNFELHCYLFDTF